MSTTNAHEPRTRNGLVVVIALLLAAPLVALLWVGSYAKPEPELLGFPFFYWYQFLWVFLAAGCTSVAYRILLHVRGERAAPHGGAGQDASAR